MTDQEYHLNDQEIDQFLKKKKMHSGAIGIVQQRNWVGQAVDYFLCSSIALQRSFLWNMEINEKKSFQYKNQLALHNNKI